MYQKPSEMWELIKMDYCAILEKDPACEGRAEALFCYPGFHALIGYRLSHAMYQFKILKLPARIFSATIIRLCTGVDIHPGAEIGGGCFIDHATCVVIGATAIVGKYCHILHNVTLGGGNKPIPKGCRRHPKIGDFVYLGAGAQLIGPIEVGDYGRVGANAVLNADLDSETTYVGIGERRFIPHSGNGKTQ